MKLKSLTYTSLAGLDLTADELAHIHRLAQDNNALDGITGLLIYNGTHFLQIIEGAEQAIDDLVERLRRDPRHSAVEVRDWRFIDSRNFPDWRMELVHVSTDAQAAKAHLDSELPGGIAEPVRQQLHQMTEAISGDVRLD